MRVMGVHEGHGGTIRVMEWRVYEFHRGSMNVLLGSWWGGSI